MITLYSADTVRNKDGTENINNNFYPTEFVNASHVEGFQLPKLVVKVNASVILSRSLDIKPGICFGTILQVIY